MPEEDKISTAQATVQSVLGEVLWHAVTVDPTLLSISEHHFHEISRVIGTYLPQFGAPARWNDVLFGRKRQNRLLEVASYAHVTGYQVAKQFNADVALTDISVETLALGARVAGENDLPLERVSRIACDFHDLPFEDDQFDMVYIASALHHTWNWQSVVRQMMRVLAPGGLLFVQNEPVHRALALYKFRTNRPDALRPFEKALAKAELSRIVGDPIPGSRPEILFGMIENQTIPLAGLKTELRRWGSIEEFTAGTNESIGDFEKALLARRDQTVQEIETFLLTELTRRVEEVRPSLTPDDIALGYSLPSEAELTELARATAPLVRQLPADSSSDEYIDAAAALFGAAIKLVVRKNGRARAKRSRPLRYAWGTRAGVAIGYPPEVNRLLEGALDLLPDVQTAHEDELHKAFPRDEWTIVDTKVKVRVLVSKGTRATIRCAGPEKESTVTLLFRVNVAHHGEHYRVRISHDGVALKEIPVYQSDSMLIQASVRAVEPEIRIVAEFLQLTGDMPAGSPQLGVMAARACALQQELEGR
jgi:ubiquinone/menaquinone biosynthesis C-methylase UbiE